MTDLTIYHFVFLKRDPEGEEAWSLDKAIDILTKDESVKILEKAENLDCIVLTVQPKPEEDIQLRVVQLDQTFFIVVKNTPELDDLVAKTLEAEEKDEKEEESPQQTFDAEIEELRQKILAEN